MLVKIHPTKLDKPVRRHKKALIHITEHLTRQENLLLQTLLVKMLLCLTREEIKIEAFTVRVCVCVSVCSVCSLTAAKCPYPLIATDTCLLLLLLLSMIPLNRLMSSLNTAYNVSPSTAALSTISTDTWMWGRQV